MSFDLLRSEWAYLTGAFVTLLFIVDPFAMVPTYLTLTERFSDEGKRAIRSKACFIALSLLILFALTGMRLFQLFGITLPAFQIAGGLLLVILGINQLNASRRKVSTAEEDEGLVRDDISVFPLAMPLLAGPGAISTVILLATKAASILRLAELVTAVTACIVVTFVVLRFAGYLQKLLGTTGLTLLSRIMGIVLTAVAVQFILNGVKEALPWITGR
jgi:multiple antibiotic resistance protein